MEIDERYLENFFHEIEEVMSDRLGVSLSVKKNSIYDINARIQVIQDNEYLLTLYSGLFYGIDRAVNDFLTQFDSNDYLWFADLAEFNDINFMNTIIQWEFIDDNQLQKQVLSNMFTSLIIQNVIFHEAAHIKGNHLNVEREYYEFDPDVIGNIETQSKEMYADYEGARMLLEVLTEFFIKKFSRDNHFNWDDSDDVNKFLRNVFVVGFLTMYFQFNLQDSDTSITFDTNHPDIKVRLFYCILLFRNEIVDSISEEDETSFSVGDLFDKFFLDEICIYIRSFLNLTELKFNSIFTEEVVNHYFSLLDYSGEKTINGEIGFLSPIDETYKNSVKNFVERVSDPYIFRSEWYEEISNVLDSSVDD